MAGLTATNITTYLAKWRDRGYTVTEITGTSTDASEVAAAVTGKAIVVIGFVLDCNTNGISVAFLSAATAKWTLYFPVAGSVIVKNLNLQCAVSEAFNLNKSDGTSALTGYIVWKACKLGEVVQGWD